MTHYEFGSIEGQADGDGRVNLMEAVLFGEWSTLAVETISETEAMPVIVLEIAGRVNKREDTLKAAFLLPVMDAGGVAAALAHAVTRIGTQEAIDDFQAGFAEEMEKHTHD